MTTFDEALAASRRSYAEGLAAFPGAKPRKNDPSFNLGMRDARLLPEPPRVSPMKGRRHTQNTRHLMSMAHKARWDRIREARRANP